MYIFLFRFNAVYKQASLSQILTLNKSNILLYVSTQQGTPFFCV